MVFCCPPSLNQTSRSTPPIVDSIIACPICGTAKAERMPMNACRITYKCTGCGETLRPKQGACCVFCSYGSVPCPPVQAGTASTLF